MHLLALLFASIVFVPLDDRPVTAQLPVMLGDIAGVTVKAPPARLLGRYLVAGQPDAIIAWMNHQLPQRNDAFVVSSDMLAYGGLVASRVPGTTYADAYSRLKELAHVRAAQPVAWIGTFGTVMRLAPTGVPASTHFFAAYPGWTYLQQYANLHDPPLPSEIDQAARLRALAGEPLIDAYLATRARNLAVDRTLVQWTAAGTIDRLVLGQDDAGAVGLHVKDVQQLQADVRDRQAGERVSIEPGADELGMALVAHAIARKAGWVPRIGVRYSTPDGAAYRDPLEYAPVATAIDGLIRLCGGTRDDTHPQIVLNVRLPHTDVSEDAAFTTAMQADVAAGRSVALADLSFLASYRDQAGFARALLESGLAAKLDAYASWNTNANTVGTALSEAIAAGAGRRMGTYGALAHRTFTFMRFVDDYAFHDEVRDDLNATLASQGIADHTLLDPPVSAEMAARTRALLWNGAQALLPMLDPGYHIAALSIGLPWDRTFETRIDVGLAPNL